MTLKLKKTLDNIWPINGKRVLIRVDFNVPIKGGVIQNDYRVRAALPTILKIVDNGGVCILASHLGRPKGVPMSEQGKGYEENYSLKPIVQRLSELLNRPVFWAADCLDAMDIVERLKVGDTLLLENVRFYTEEGSKKETDNIAMAEKLVRYCDYYVSDAFGTAHRDSATMTAVPRLIGHGAAGYLMEREIVYFSRLLGNPPRPMLAIVGGSKVSDKILLLENMLEQINYLFIGGAMAYTFLKSQGYEIGSSFCETTSTNSKGETIDIIALANQLLKKAEAKGVEVFLPIDHVCNTEFKENPDPLVTKDCNIPEGYMALDIGPKTIVLFQNIIRKSKCAIWNGPMGVFEMTCYSKGTFTIAKTLADETENNGMLSIIGGGDSASAAEICGAAPRFSHVSTGGGASLELLEGKKLPGIAILDDLE